MSIHIGIQPCRYCIYYCSGFQIYTSLTHRCLRTTSSVQSSVLWIIRHEEMFLLFNWSPLLCAAGSLGGSIITFVEVKDLNTSTTEGKINTNGHSVKGEHSLCLFKGWFHQFWKSTDRNTKSLRSQSSDLMFPVRNSPTRRPETSRTSYRVECHRQIPVHLVLTPKKQKATRTSEQLRSTWWASNMKTSISPWRFWPNSSSHSLIFYLYYFSNTFCKCNMKSTITRKIDTSLWSLL